MNKNLSKIAVALGMPANSDLNSILNRATGLTVDALPDISNLDDGDAFHAAFDRIEAQIRSGACLRVDVFLTDPENLAADVRGPDGALLPPITPQQKATAQKVAEAGVDAGTASQVESAAKRGAPVGPPISPTDPSPVSA